MTVYRNFIGIDIGKFTFVVNVHQRKASKEYNNTPEGIHLFLKGHRSLLKQHTLCVLEATGGYELALLLRLCEAHIAVHRANTRKVKHFIQSYGNAAKTDHLDAMALSRYGAERAAQLDLYQPSSPNALALYELVQRRRDLKQMLVAEKNRSQSPRINLVKEGCDRLIKQLETQGKEINQAIEEIISHDAVLAKKREILMTVPGIGKIVASELLAMMPELGQLNRRRIASLAGLAPRANDSGQYRGYRRVAPGRNHIKPMLFLAAMAARNSNSSLKTYYNQLIERGKKKMVALVALMRKILVIANARIKEAKL